MAQSRPLTGSRVKKVSTKCRLSVDHVYSGTLSGTLILVPFSCHKTGTSTTRTSMERLQTGSLSYYLPGTSRLRSVPSSTSTAYSSHNLPGLHCHWIMETYIQKPCLVDSTSTLHTSTLPWSGSKFTMSFPIRYDRSRGDDRVFFITTAAWTAFGKTCVTLLLNRFLHLDLVTVRERNRAAKHQSIIVFFHSLLHIHSMVTAKQYARHQGQFPNMGGVIYEI